MINKKRIFAIGLLILAGSMAFAADLLLLSGTNAPPPADPAKDAGVLAARDAYWKAAADGQFNRAELAEALQAIDALHAQEKQKVTEALAHQSQMNQIGAALPGLLKALSDACTKAGGELQPDQKTGNQDCVAKPKPPAPPTPEKGAK